MHFSVRGVRIDPEFVSSLLQLAEFDDGVCLGEVKCFRIDTLVVVFVGCPGIGRCIDHSCFHSLDRSVGSELAFYRYTLTNLDGCRHRASADGDFAGSGCR